MRIQEATPFTGYDPSYYEHSYATPGERYHEMYARDLPEWAKAMNAWAVESAIAMAGLDPHRDEILDLGSGTGHYVSQWERRGFKVTGVEISPTAVRLAANPNIIQGDIRDLSHFGHKQFAFGMSCAVLEHIPLDDCVKVMAGLAHCCAANGHVIGHDVGEDPSHINVMPAQKWAEWFADRAPENHTIAVAAANILAPTMPYFFNFDVLPVGMEHSLRVYQKSPVLVRLA